MRANYKIGCLVLLFFLTLNTTSAEYTVGRIMALCGDNPAGSSELYLTPNSNPAKYSESNDLIISAEITPIRYLIPDMNSVGLYGVFPLINNKLGMIVGTSGLYNSLISEYEAFAGMGLGVTENISVGANFTLTRFKITEANDYLKWSATLGSFLKISDSWCAGANISLGDDYEHKSVDLQEVRLGVGYNSVDGVALDVGMNIIPDQIAQYVVSVKFFMTENFDFVSAYKTKPNCMNLGIDYKISNSLGVTIIFERNENLSLTNFILVRYKF